ncbi:uncharacterized protein PRCAT00005028001 [Priceomyces carsonii]|uniref:uncharacterized protein n=1 Tax=Priceomyces carsonii TaxID=28549 RepID=UPI002ED84D25|nr:unnamed protein product [Priceomyces carsonii]
MSYNSKSDEKGDVFEVVDYDQGKITSLSEDGKKSKWQKILEFFEVDHEEMKGLSPVQMFLYNYDLRPVEEERRKWSWYNFVNFWIADSFNVNTWQIASTGVTAGMTWWQTWLSVWLGYFLTGLFVSLGARVGIYNHISFPVAIRSSFGIFGSLWPILNRVVMSCVWYSVQAWIGGECVRLMLMSIFGYNLNDRMLTFPDKSTDTLGYLSFFLFWLFSLPAIWFPPHQIRHLFTFKSYVVPIAGFGFLIWTLVKANGAGSVIREKGKLHGSALAWAFIESSMNSMANFATLITNAPDFSRFADKPSRAIKYWVYIASIPICFSITCLIGILVSSASGVIYTKETMWSPLDVLQEFLSSYTRGNRGGVFLISLCFALAQLGTNISANSLSFGTDVTAMLPRFMNIRRGGFLCAALALCICPWRLMESSSKFTTVLSAYAVFLSSICGVSACDYYILRRGYINLPHLYTLKVASEDGKGSIDSYYKYNFTGCNWRAYFAYISGILPNIVGFVGATGYNVPIGAQEVYRLSFPVGFGTSFLIYYILCVYVSPVTYGVPPDVKKFGKSWYEEWKNVESFDQELIDNSPYLLEAVRSAEGVKASKSHENDMGNMIKPITSLAPSI